MPISRDLQAQLEGTENRITVARQRFIRAVQEYNVTVRSFPTNLTAMMFGHKVKPAFTVETSRPLQSHPRWISRTRAGARSRSGTEEITACVVRANGNFLLAALLFASPDCLGR